MVSFLLEKQQVGYMLHHQRVFCDSVPQGRETGGEASRAWPGNKVLWVSAL